MEFDCKEISISEEELGCQVTFSENQDLGAQTETMSVKEIIESTGRYLLLQSSFSEDDFENDNYYYETNDENLYGDLVDFEMILTRNKFELKLPIEKIKISISPTKKEYSELKRVLPIITGKKGRLIINK
jgi:hypothetical protein